LSHGTLRLASNSSPHCFHFENEGTWSSGFATKFEAVLTAFPKATFIGHADAFWANVSADYHNEAAYPAGPIVRGHHRSVPRRLSESVWRSVGQLGQQHAVARRCVHTRVSQPTSGQAALRERLRLGGWTRRRHQSREQPGRGKTAGKCVARETLTIRKRSASDAVFRKITWDNVHRLLRIPQ
jgi:hypothetical protein